VSQADQCVAKKADGSRCQIQSGLSERGLCLWHDEHRKVEAARARRRGGVTAGRRKRENRIRTVEAGQAPPPPESLEDAVEWASWATHAVATGLIDSRTAHEVGYLLNALRGALEKAHIAEEVRELREQLEVLRPGRRQGAGT